MSMINGTYRNGQVTLDEKVNWPEGKRVHILDEIPEFEFRQEDDDLQDPEEIQRIVDLMKSFEPMFTSPEEEKQFLDALAWSKENNLKMMKKEWGLDS